MPLSNSKFFFFFLLPVQLLVCQVKIGDNPDQIDEFSLLELESPNKALVLTRVNKSEMEMMRPVEGALVYNTDEKCLFYYQGSSWFNLCSESTGLSIIENEDGTFTFPGSEGPVTIHGAPETNTSIINNNDGTYTYINERNEEQILNTGIIGGDHVGTSGSVFFANDSNGAPFESNEDFFWDNTNKRLGIGTNSPSNELEVDGILKSARITSSFGTASFPSYHFTGSFNSGMFAPSAGQVGLVSEGREVVRVRDGNRVGIMVSNPEATLHVGGNLIVNGAIIERGGKKTETTAVKRIELTTGAIYPSDHTVIISKKTAKISLPPAPRNEGQILIIKDLGGAPTELSVPYVNLDGSKFNFTIDGGVLWLQSDGVNWQRIN